jgi:hypothetical protein
MVIPTYPCYTACLLFLRDIITFIGEWVSARARDRDRDRDGDGDREIIYTP